MNTLVRMNAETYAAHWSNESVRFEKQNLYVKLSNISPKERVLEIGCGNGLGTKQLASGQQVLVIEKNSFLLHKAREENSDNPNVTFIEADFFNLSSENIEQVLDFSPQGIVAWLIGSDPDTVESRTPKGTALTERPKLYREAIEDLLVLEPLCTPSVKWIHLANRVVVDAAAADKNIIDSTKKDYEDYMFLKSSFLVSDVKIIDWGTGSNDFLYVAAANPKFSGSNVRNCVISIMATRK